MSFFSRRRKRESAVPDSANDQALGAFANPEGQPVVGQQVGGGQPGIDLQGLGAVDGIAALAQLGPMIQQAMASGNVQISQGESQVIDMRGSGLREEIMGIMGEHGIPTDGGTANMNVDAGAYGDMQKQILETLAKHGINTGTPGTSINFPAPPAEGEPGQAPEQS
jgi:hypothetical protein